MVITSTRLIEGCQALVQLQATQLYRANGDVVLRLPHNFRIFLGPRLQVLGVVVLPPRLHVPPILLHNHRQPPRE